VQQLALDLRLALIDPSVMIKLDSSGIDSFCWTMFFDLFDFRLWNRRSFVIAKQSFGLTWPVKLLIHHD
jgi:hypothetical protein